jgi:tRNA A-37 threonylcarbamoyl transferase component Bud32
VLDAAAVQALADCQSETELVKHLTPVLWRLRVSGEGSDDDDACRFVLVNGENCKWLDNLVQPLRPQLRFKPDLFLAPRVCVKERAGTDKQGSGDCFIFGGLAHRHLQRDGCVREVFDAKLESLKQEHLGKLVKYHLLIPGECRGMVFNGSQFWLFSSLDGHALKLVKGTWAAPGSAHLVRRFFEDQPPPPPPLLPLLRHLLSALRLRPTQVDGSAFLGAGSSGRVFAVQSTEPATRHAQRMALKLVPAAASDEWLFNLTHEFKVMQDAAALGVPVVPVVADSLRLLEGVGGGYLLARCGVPLDATASQETCCAAFAALAALHARAVVHGDARLPNLLLVDGHSAWLDLSTGVLAGLASHARSVHCRLDVETLACSVLQAAGVAFTPLPQSVAAAIAAYSDSADAVHIATAVWAAARGFRKDATLPASGTP